MSHIVTRAQWGALPATGDGNAINAHPDGTAIHYEGPKMGSRDHAQCAALVRSIQADHIHRKGWVDIAYNLVVCEHGYIFVARGTTAGSAANGTTDANRRFLAVCLLMGKGDPMPAAMVDGAADAIQLCRDAGAANKLVGHRDLFATECPGALAYALVAKGWPRATPGPTTPTAPPAAPPTKAPATVVTAKAPRFPLAGGYYFGPKDGPAQSVSGYYSHAADLALWQRQMRARGWKNSKGAPLATDGLYGDETARVAGLFQAQCGLHVDRLIGPATWAAAWSADLT